MNHKHYQKQYEVVWDNKMMGLHNQDEYWAYVLVPYHYIKLRNQRNGVTPVT